MTLGTPLAFKGGMSNLHQELVEEHARLDESLNALACAAEGASHQELLRTWTEFETKLSHHLELEENELFPLAEPFHAEAVKSLRLAHGRIRAIVAELGVRAELHTLRKPAVDWLVEALLRHAEHEDRTLYHWVDELAPEDTRRHLASLMVKTLRASRIPTLTALSMALTACGADPMASDAMANRLAEARQELDRHHDVVMDAVSLPNVVSEAEMHDANMERAMGGMDDAMAGMMSHCSGAGMGEMHEMMTDMQTEMRDHTGALERAADVASAHTLCESHTERMREMFSTTHDALDRTSCTMMGSTK